jgi:thymidylate synthase
MGRETFFSIPECKRPLKNRFNVVVTSNPGKYVCQNDNVVFMTNDEVMSFLNSQSFSDKCFFIGGERIYSAYMKHCESVFVTYIDKEYACDRFFPMDQLAGFELTSVSEKKHAEKEQCDFRFFTYQRTIKPNHDDVYLGLLNDIMSYGHSRDDRTGTGTLSVFGKQVRFDISESVPLLTTKFVPWKMVIKELLWFMQGNTDANVLRSQGVNIWNGNTTREFLDKRGLSTYQEGDIGPMYGFQWRHYGAEYTGSGTDYTGKGIDQLQNVMDLLKNDPYSRRILMTTVNVNDLEKGCLHPCHGIVVQFYVNEDSNGNKHLSCHMYQRSVDTFLGLTWNIFSYAVLTYILAKKLGMKPKELVISTGDTHLYKDHVEQANVQLGRTSYPAPKLAVHESVVNKPFEDITIDDFDLIGYFHHPAIKAKMSI